jgi:hypothetical protein
MRKRAKRIPKNKKITQSTKKINYSTDILLEFFDVMNSNNIVHFNLTGPDGKMLDVWNAVLEGSQPNARVTSWELSQIYQTPEWWSRITWWHNGQKVPNPFE